MKNNKLVEILSIAVFMMIALQFIIFPGLESDNFAINVVSLTSFVLLVGLVAFSGLFTYTDNDQNSEK